MPDFLHAIEDSSVPWRSPDGRKFYRIRVGLVLDNVPSSWPCQYEVPEEWERFPFQREERPVRTSMKCIPEADEVSPKVRALVRSLRAWAKANPLPEPKEKKAEKQAKPLPEPTDEPGAEEPFEEAERYLFPSDWTEPDL